MPHRVCACCSAEFACPASFRGKNPKCSGCRATHPQRQHAPAHGGGAPQNGAAGSAPRHMTPCACHCAACCAAGHGNTCVMVSLSLVQLFPENADIVDLVLRPPGQPGSAPGYYYQGASGWDTARFDSAIMSVQYGPAGDVIAAGAGYPPPLASSQSRDGRIHLICTQTGAKNLCLKGHR
jgi:hypothetical protein